MSNKVFYSLPFRVEKLVTNKGTLDKCDLESSIRQNLRLLLMTRPMRIHFAPSYGCKIHWHQFMVSNRLMEEDKYLEDNFKVKIEKNIKQIIGKHEKRLQVTEVIVDIRYVLEDHIKWRFSRKKRINNSIIQIIVNIKGKIQPKYALSGQSLLLKDTIPLL